VTAYERYFDALIELPPAMRAGISPMDLVREIAAAPGEPLPFLVSDIRSARPLLGSGIFPPTARTTNPPGSSVTEQQRTAGVRPSTARTTRAIVQLDLALERAWPFAADALCAVCDRGAREAIAMQARLKASERATVREERGHVSMIAVCAGCLMPLGYQVQSDTADPSAPTIAQRGPARPSWKGGHGL
jgi:hypothetical protein